LRAARCCCFSWLRFFCASSRRRFSCLKFGGLTKDLSRLFRLLFGEAQVETLYVLCEQQADLPMRARAHTNNPVGTLCDDVALPHSLLACRRAHLIDGLELKWCLRQVSRRNMSVCHRGLPRLSGLARVWLRPTYQNFSSALLFFVHLANGQPSLSRNHLDEHVGMRLWQTQRMEPLPDLDALSRIPYR
jgi:hypothetical protein